MDRRGWFVYSDRPDAHVLASDLDGKGDDRAFPVRDGVQDFPGYSQVYRLARGLFVWHERLSVPAVLG